MQFIWRNNQLESSHCLIFLLSSVWDLNDNGIVGGEEASHVINTTIKQLEETRDILSNLQNVYRNDCESKTKYDNEHPTLGQQNALKSAKQYLQTMPFSYNGLIKQLKYEGYTDSEAEYGAKNCGADWYYQASIAAKNYLDIMPFSRKSLIEQLQYEGYTYEQAVYGVEQNGY